MNAVSGCRNSLATLAVVGLLACGLPVPLAHAANPVGPTVAQGTATFTTQGSQLTIQTSDRAFINWQSFNIGVGQTTTFVQPSSTSVVWNQINDSNPSQILGNLNANGYVILQNSAGFYVGGEASIHAGGGVLMTTAPISVPDLSMGGVWQFNAPPPTASIINYGQIGTDKGGSVYLISHNIENHGTISAPQGSIGLYAGKQVLVSERPDGRGLSATVTLPEGSVDNSGRLIADAGTIALNARVVNQGGLIQANSVREVNGVIELVAEDKVNLASTSVIQATGDPQAAGASQGGTVTIKSGNTFQDDPCSIISVAGGSAGGNGGRVEISAPNMAAIQSQVDGHAANGFTGGSLLLDPVNVTLDSTGASATSGTINQGDPPDTLMLNVNSFASFSQITVQASQNITLNTLWTLANQNAPSQLTLQAGNNITFNANSGISAGRNWAISLYAGADFTKATPAVIPGVGSILLNPNNPITTAGGPISLQAGQDISIYSPWILANASTPAVLSLQAGNNINLTRANGSVGGSLSLGENWSVDLAAGVNFQPSSAVSPGNGGVYLTQDSYVASLNGDINIQAFNEVLVGTGGISTYEGGNITVAALKGNVNCGTSPIGYVFNGRTGYSLLPYTLGDGIEVGGVSTAAGGDVSISAGQDVISYLPPLRSGADAGSGAFGPEPGIVTIEAGRNVTGHYVAANSTQNGSPVASTISAGLNAGAPGKLLALSLVKGGWSVNAPNGSIDLQEVRNPNGTLNTKSGPQQNQFDYDPLSFVALNAGIGVEIGSGVILSSTLVPVIFPPTLTINAGAGGVQLDGNVTLFPSPFGELNITTTGGGSLYALQSVSAPQQEAGINFELNMSDSGSTRWVASAGTFGDGDHASVPIQLNNLNPVVLDISGNLSDLTLAFPKAAHITVAGDMLNTHLLGQNLRLSDVTSINVAGQLLFRSQSTYYQLTQPLPGYENSDSAIAILLQNAYDANGQQLIFNPPIFSYNPNTLQVAIVGKLDATTYQALSQIAQTQLFINGVPQFTYDPNDPIMPYHPVLVPATFLTPSALSALYANSRNVPDSLTTGLQLAGPGTFKITAGSIALPDNGAGIDTSGAALNTALAPLASSGANIMVATTSGDLKMDGSFISTLSGGGITINSAGAVEVGTAQDFGFANSVTPRGIYVEAQGDLSVTANGDISVAGSRIVTFDGGNITLLSNNGNIDAGNGSQGTFTPTIYQIDPASGRVLQIQPTFSGSGIEALTLPATLTGYDQVAHRIVTLDLGSTALPGNITVSTPHGNIVASSGGIVQEPLNGNTAAGPVVRLSAGSRDALGNVTFVGNMDLSGSGVIGEAVNANATGTINGLLVGSQSVTITTPQAFNGTVLSAGSASVSASSVSGNIIGVTGISISQGAVVSANLFSQNVNVGGAQAQGLATTATASVASQNAVATANEQTEKATALPDSTSSDDDSKKRAGRAAPTLVKRIGRVTVLLPKA